MALEVGWLKDLNETTRYDHIAKQISDLLSQRSSGSECSEDRLRSVAKQSFIVVAADVDRGKNKKFDIIGMCCLIPMYLLSGTAGQVENVIINKSYFPDNDAERLAIERRIIEICIELARAKNISNLEIPARYISHNTIAMYHDLGFVVLEQRLRHKTAEEAVAKPSVDVCEPDPEIDLY